MKYHTSNLILISLLIIVITPQIQSHLVILNEILVRPPALKPSWIEIWNPNNFPVNISGWTLFVGSVSFPIPSNIILEPSGVFGNNQEYYVYHFAVGYTLPITETTVSLNHGTTHIHSITYTLSPPSITFGYYVTSDMRQLFVLLSSETPKAVNAPPLVGPVVISEIMFAPPQVGSSYIVIQNVGSSNITLNEVSGLQWTIQSSTSSFLFPLGTILAPQTLLILTTLTPPTQLYQIYNIPTTIPILKISNFTINPISDTLKIGRPHDIMVHLFYSIETISYMSKSPWPVDAVKTGNSIVRKSLSKFGDDPINWGLSGALNLGVLFMGPFSWPPVPKVETTWVVPLESNFFYFPTWSNLYVIAYIMVIVVCSIILMVLLGLGLRWLIVHGEPKLDQQ